MRKLFILILLLLMLAGCANGPAATPTPGQPETPIEPTAAEAGPVQLTVMTHDSFSASEDVIAAFEAETNIQLTFLQSGDTGSALNRAILSKNAPLADVFYGVDDTFLSRALQEDIFDPYDSPALAEIPDEFKLDPENRALPVDFGDVCINYDKAYFAENNLAVPAGLADLLKPEYAGLLVVENPATSSPGLSFLLATIVEYGQDGYLDYWRALRENGVVVVNDWETAYYTNFSGSSGRGPQPMVVSYGTSPAAEVIFADRPLDDAPTASITGSNTCYRQIEFAGILKGTQNRAAAEQFIDFMLGVEFQSDVPGQMFVYPVNPEARLPEAFEKYAHAPDDPAELDPAVVAENREQWIQDWTQAVLR